MRSLLFVPGDAPRKIEKALEAHADVVILDLEDSVAFEAKDGARATLVEALGALAAAPRAAGPAVYIRVNALGTGLTEADLRSVLPGRPAGIVQPKSESAASVRELAGLMTTIEAELGQEAAATPILAIATETADSLFHLGGYAHAGPRLQGLAWGAEDLSADLGAHTNKDAAGHHTEPYRLARTLCLIGARAAGVEPIDTVHVNFRDEAGLKAECEAAVRDGFTGKLAIHPAQVPVINAAFTPQPEAVLRAELIVAAFRNAGSAGVVSIEGEMLDRPHLVRAERLLDRAARYAKS